MAEQPYVRKGKLPACIFTHQDALDLFALVHGPNQEAGQVEIAVEYRQEGIVQPEKISFSEQRDFLEFLTKGYFIENFVLGFNYRNGSDQIFISFVNTPTPSGSLYLFGEQAWVDEQFALLGNFFHARQNTLTTRLFNGFSSKIFSVVIPFISASFLITLVLAIALPTKTRIEYFGVLTVACVYGTFKFGLMLSEYFIKKLSERYPYFSYKY